MKPEKWRKFANLTHWFTHENQSFIQAILIVWYCRFKDAAWSLGLHFVGAVWHQFTFLHRLKWFVNPVFANANRWPLEHLILTQKSRDSVTLHFRIAVWHRFTSLHSLKWFVKAAFVGANLLHQWHLMLTRRYGGSIVVHFGHRSDINSHPFIGWSDFWILLFRMQVAIISDIWFWYKSIAVRLPCIV
jgi:hypothetical protein